MGDCLVPWLIEEASGPANPNTLRFIKVKEETKFERLRRFDPVTEEFRSVTSLEKHAFNSKHVHVQRWKLTIKLALFIFLWGWPTFAILYLFITCPVVATVGHWILIYVGTLLYFCALAIALIAPSPMQARKVFLHAFTNVYLTIVFILVKILFDVPNGEV